MAIFHDPEDMPEHYEFDYSKAKPNRFAGKMNRTSPVIQEPAAGDDVRVTLDADVARVFPTAESVNRALRAIIQAIPAQALAPSTAR